jgi:hypothetical protein
MHNGLRFKLGNQGKESMILFGDVDVVKADRFSGQLCPDADALADRTDRGKRRSFEFVVDVTSGKIVDNYDFMAPGRKVQGRRPAAKAIAAKNENFHRSALRRIH